MDLAGEIMRMTPADGARLAEAAMLGAPDDVRRYVFYSAWRGMVADRTVPRRKRPALLRAIMGAVEVEVS
jgi:hypothetical protein